MEYQRTTVLHTGQTYPEYMYTNDVNVIVNDIINELKDFHSCQLGYITEILFNNIRQRLGDNHNFYNHCAIFERCCLLLEIECNITLRKNFKSNYIF